MLNVHFTSLNAHSAVNAFLFIEFNSDKCDFVKETVNCAERAEETAETTINEYARHYENNQQAEFPGKQITESVEKRCVAAIYQQSARAAESPCGTYIFTESGHSVIYQRNRNNQNREQNVF